MPVLNRQFGSIEQRVDRNRVIRLLREAGADDIADRMKRCGQAPTSSEPTECDPGAENVARLPARGEISCDPPALTARTFVIKFSVPN